jgi:hypothetical protein
MASRMLEAMRANGIYSSPFLRTGAKESDSFKVLQKEPVII